MKPPHTRLTCRAHNRFSPSLVLWQHFVGTDRPFLHHQRLSSTATDSIQNGTSREISAPSSGESRGLLQLEAEAAAAKEDGALSKPPQLNIRKMKTVMGTWHPSKAKASSVKNVQKLYEERKASLTEPEKLLATARTAFEDSKDYVGVVVQPMVSPIPCRESSLPWCLPKEQLTMSGIDRLGIEIDRFYEHSKPDYNETVARRHLIEQVRHHVRQVLPNHVLEVFGSERTGLALATSDIDFRLMVKERFEDSAVAKLPPTPEQRVEGMRSLHQLHWTLSKHKAYFLARLRHARYPLVSLQDRNSGLDIQIVLSNDTSVSREFVKRYTGEYPYLRKLFFVVKTMFDVRGLSDVFRGGFGSYSLFMMLVASLKHSPHPRNDAAGGLINFLKFYRNLDTTKWGVSIEPTVLFDKKENPVLTDTARAKIAEGTAKPLPPYMLCLRDPADSTNDLGRKAIAIKHVQTTFKKLCYELNHNMAVNTRASILGPLVGSSYMLNKNRRERLHRYGARLSSQLKESLAAKAKMVRERELEAEKAQGNQQTEEEKEAVQLARETRDAEWLRVSEARNKKLAEEAERTAVLEHGDAMASILGMPSVEHEAERPKTRGGEQAERESSTGAESDVKTQSQPMQDFPTEEANSGAEKRSMDDTLTENARKASG